jgi:hypothetical protein
MKLQDFSSFSSIEEYERYQKERILQVLLVSTLVILFPIIYGNMGHKEGLYSTIALFIICLVGMLLNAFQMYILAAIIYTGAVYAAVFFNFVDGYGLRDMAIMVLPMITVFGSLLFNRMVSVLLTAISAGMVMVFHILQGQGFIDNPIRAETDTIITILSLLFAMNILQIAVLRVWMRNMDWVLYSNDQLKLAYDTTLEGWAKTLELRDLETEGHSRRVVKLTVGLAREMGIKNKELLQQITRGALLHDIGKIAIPDSILLKNGPLTEEERELIEMHPSLAEKMMSEIPFLHSAMEIPRYHHERWDGNGYPYGLAGEDIPLAARIFTVIDNYDALLSDRPYRKAWGSEKTMEYIQENTGKIFDPNVVAAFRKMMELG